MVFCGVVAVGGQLVVNQFVSRRSQIDDGADNSWLQSKWSPLKKMTDDEYRAEMDEKILSVDADVALINDRIAQLQLQQAGYVADTPPEKQSPK